MKNSVLFLAICLICFSFNCLGQKKHAYFHGHHHVNHHQNNSLNFAGGLLAGVFLSEFFGSSHDCREMYFVYNHRKDNWRLKKDVYKKYSPFYSSTKIVARFENPNGGRDFFVKINNNGNWFLDCPKRLKKLFRNKVRQNI